MYEVDDKDRLVELENVPQWDTGSPSPVVLSDEYATLLGYNEAAFTDWETAKVEDLKASMVVIRFTLCRSMFFGSPNDEALNGHPLYERGLKPYGAYEVESSSWIRKLERMNRDHYLHDPKRHESDRHLIFTFHDSTFECITTGYEVIRLEKPWSGMVLEMQKMLLKNNQ